MQRPWERIANLILVILIVVNLCEIAFFLVLRNHARLYSGKVLFPVPSGYLQDGTFLPPSPSPCYLVRLTSDDCPYCKADRELYAGLARAASVSKCSHILLSPRAGQISGAGIDKGISVLQYVDMKFGKAILPFATPETLILDSQGAVTWDHEGVISRQDLAEALRALRKLN